MSDRIEELNHRIASRVYASAAPSLLFSPRPVPTKYVKMPMVNDPVPPTVRLENRAQHVGFLPTDAKGPGALDLVDLESTLKNMDFALQRNGRAVYVPASQSDLYRDPSVKPATPVQQTHPNLFKRVITSDTGIPPHVRPGQQPFYNPRFRTPA
jgi:hypothetical protein